MIFPVYDPLVTLPLAPQVLARLGTFVCASAASDTWRQTLQRDRSLLVTSVGECVGQGGGEKDYKRRKGAGEKEGVKKETQEIWEEGERKEYKRRKRWKKRG